MFGTILMQKVVSAPLCAAALVGLPGCSVLQTPDLLRRGRPKLRRLSGPRPTASPFLELK